MLGLEILDIVIGLAFVYLLLSLICTAVNEYVAAMLDRRGKELIRGIDQLLGRDPRLRRAFYSHPLISSLFPPGGRNPSYMPARSFALALLSVTDYPRRIPGEKAAAAGVATPPRLRQALDTLRTDSAADVSELLLAPDMAPVLASPSLPPEVRMKLVGLAVGSESELHKLQDSVEVWFNGAMDRVSGSYKRYTQVMLFVIGIVLAGLLNADTIQIWRTLAVDDELREGLARRAAALVDSVNAHRLRDAAAADTAGPAGAAPDTTLPAVLAGGLAPPGPSPSTAEAERLYRAAKAELDQTSLGLGWSWAEARRLGLARPATRADAASARLRARADSVRAHARYEAQRGKWLVGGFVRRPGPALPRERAWVFQPPARWDGAAIGSKLLGLLITGIALSLGAPFWFDTLNRFINVRGAGRAPDERPRSPEAPGKRVAERATR